tara:strand:- start:43 stop:378 length:336 start_codon:yes stop_codon:yes gene_type:complete
MMSITFVLRWSWVLGMALFLPVSLPAGGLPRNQIGVLRADTSRFLFAGDSCVFQVSPFVIAPSLCTVEIGTPLRVLRSWKSADGKDWLHVQISSNYRIESPLSIRRGWINV